MEKVKELRSISPNDYKGQWNLATKSRVEKIMKAKIDEVCKGNDIAVNDVDYLGMYYKIVYNVYNKIYIKIINSLSRLNNEDLIECVFDNFEKAINRDTSKIKLLRGRYSGLLACISDMEGEHIFDCDNKLSSEYPPFYCITTFKVSPVTMYSDFKWEDIIPHTEMRCIVHAYRDHDTGKYYMLDYNGKTYVYDMDRTYITYMERHDIIKYLAQNDINIELLQRKINNTRNYISNQKVIPVQSYRLERRGLEIEKTLQEENKTSDYIDISDLSKAIETLFEQNKLFYIDKN